VYELESVVVEEIDLLTKNKLQYNGTISGNTKSISFSGKPCIESLFRK